ncbi:MAG: RNA polymerase sporulation sigma factor SigE [Oscillospiraceae bacterium]|jgi:RNA polymerase sporulation-specific sigma factor|nr:RNA polymerase sporulation sigma factor SigE [Oscillospiraceae bacterium]
MNKGGVRVGAQRRRLLAKILQWLRRRKKGDVYYINGAQALPLPLTKEEEAQAMERLRGGDERVRELLITRNLRLVVYIAKKFENSGVGVEDLISIGTIGLIKAVNTFCPQKNIKLATYASRCIENEILMHLRKISPTKGDISIDEPLNIDWDGNELLLSDILGSDADSVDTGVEDDDERDLLLRCVNSLDPRERKIMHMRFGMGGLREHTQKEVADIMGISQSYISRLEKKIIDKLRRDMDGAGCAF